MLLLISLDGYADCFFVEKLGRERNTPAPKGGFSVYNLCRRRMHCVVVSTLESRDGFKP
jgi:hypothetical protein